MARRTRFPRPARVRKWWALALSLLLVWVFEPMVVYGDGEPVPCKELAAKLGPKLRTPTGLPAGAQCIVRERFFVLGREYIFADLVGYHRGDADRQYALVREAITKAVTLYATWFEVPEAIFFFGELTEEAADEYGQIPLAVTEGSRGSGLIVVDDSARRAGFRGDSNADQFKRTIAHELFHCVQVADPELDPVYVEWRDEGSAEYFAGLAIPESLPSNAFYDQFDEGIVSRPLYDLENSAYPFFAFLGRQRGPDAVVELLRYKRRRSDAAAQRAALRSVPDIEELFQKFAEHWADRNLPDENGRRLPLGPGRATERVEVEREMEIDGSVVPFSFFLRKARFAPQMAWRLDQPMPDNGTLASVATEEGDWRRLATTVDTCRGAKEGHLVVTSTADASDAQNFSIAVSERPGEMRDCPCPVGTWVMEGEDLARSKLNFTGGKMEGGRVTLTFVSGGTGTVNFQDIRVLNGQGEETQIRTTLSGTMEFRWRLRPWREAGLGEAPSGEGVEAVALEREFLSSNAQTRTQFLTRKGAPAGETTTPFRRDYGGGKTIVGAVCQDGTLRLIGGRSSPYPGNTSHPPHTGVFTRQ